jgi:hypothetical protein
MLEDKVVQDGDHRSVGDRHHRRGALQRRPRGTIKTALTCIEDRLSYTSLSGLAETITAGPRVRLILTQMSQEVRVFTPCNINSLNLIHPFRGTAIDIDQILMRSRVLLSSTLCDTCVGMYTASPSAGASKTSFLMLSTTSSGIVF